MGATFMAMNRNKRSVTIDLKSEEGRARLAALVPKAQVFIHNVRADAMARLGFDYETVAKLNPSIVYVHCVGYGSDGPYAGRQAFDDLVQSASGAADLLPRVDGNPDMRLLPSFVADKVSSLHALYAVLAALFHRERSGEGQFVEVPMFESFTHFMMIEHLYGKTFEPPQGKIGHTPALANDRRPLVTKDGHIAIQPVSRAASAKFLELGGIPNAYESERFVNAPKGSRVAVYYDDAARGGAGAHHRGMDEAGRAAPHPHHARQHAGRSARRSPSEAVDFFQLREHPSEGPYRAMKPPVKFSKTPATIRRDPPRPGQDNDEIGRMIPQDEDAK